VRPTRALIFIALLALALYPSSVAQIRQFSGAIIQTASVAWAKLLTTGTCNSTTYLRGDGSCAALAGGGSGIISPSISGTSSAPLNDWSPTGWAGATYVKTDISSGSPIITGASAGDGTDSITNVKMLVNTSTLRAVTLVHESTLSAAANRLDLGGKHLILWPGDSATLQYRGSRWTLVDVGENQGIRKNYAGRRPNTTTSLAVFGIPATNNGTVSHPAVTIGGNYRTSHYRTNFAGSGANVLQGTRSNVALAVVSTTAGRGGFLNRTVWAYSAIAGDTGSSPTSFLGLVNKTGVMSAGEIVPTSSCSNATLGFGLRSATGTYRNMHFVECGSGTYLWTDTGFVPDTTQVYEGWIFMAAGASQTSATLIIWRLDTTPASTPVTREVTSTANLPNNTILSSHNWIDPGSVGSANGLDLYQQEMWFP
jgi:hypothetical protein